MKKIGISLILGPCFLVPQNQIMVTQFQENRETSVTTLRYQMVQRS